jgi:hypothetical protein
VPYHASGIGMQFLQAGNVTTFGILIAISIQLGPKAIGLLPKPRPQVSVLISISGKRHTEAQVEGWL